MIVVGIAACLFSQAMFSGSEIALVSADRLKLADQAAGGSAGARLALDLIAREERLLGTCLIGTNVSVITATAFTSALLARYGLHGEYLVAAVFVPIALVFGEALPKTVYHHHATLIAPYAARFIAVCQWVFVPALLVVDAWGELLARVFKSRRVRGVTRQEILLLLEDPDHESMEPGEQQMIRRVLEIHEATVGQCMTPLVDVHALGSESTFETAALACVRSGHTRLPVYEDRVDNIIGIVHAQDLLFEVNTELTPIKSVVQTVKYVPESKRVDELLQEMRREREHFAVVVDEYGGSVGIVTAEDLLEQIIGDIRDESDKDEQDGIRRLGEAEWRLSARVEIEQLSTAIGREVPSGDYETIAGLVLSQMGKIPRKGEAVTIGDLTFRVDEATERAIVAIHLTVAPPTPRP